MFKLELPFEKVKMNHTDENSRFLKLDGLEVHYKDEGKGVPLLLLHSVFSSLHIWDEWVKILKQHFRVIRLDLPGCGLTGSTENQDYKIDTYIYFLKRFIAKIGIGIEHHEAMERGLEAPLSVKVNHRLETFYICGVAFGGLLAWHYTLLQPYTIKKLILINAMGYPQQPLPHIFRLGRSWAGKNSIPWKGSKKWIHYQLQKNFNEKFKVTDKLVKQTQELLLCNGNRTALVNLTNTDFKDRHQRIADIKTPTLVQWGNLTSIKDLFSENLPNAQFKKYQAIGYLPMIEIPVRSAMDALTFLMEN